MGAPWYSLCLYIRWTRGNSAILWSLLLIVVLVKDWSSHKRSVKCATAEKDYTRAAFNVNTLHPVQAEHSHYSAYSLRLTYVAKLCWFFERKLSYSQTIKVIATSRAVYMKHKNMAAVLVSILSRRLGVIKFSLITHRVPHSRWKHDVIGTSLTKNYWPIVLF